MPGPLQVSALTAGDTLLSHFWDLASLEEDKREHAAKALVDELLKSQKEFEDDQSSEGSEEDGEEEEQGAGVDRALRRCSPLMVYAFKRLCRGLGSSRQGARQGFALAITSLLGATECVGPSEAVAAIEGVLEPVGKGSELRDALLGRIFGYAAVARSGRAIPADLAAGMAAGLVAAAQKKSFLREAAGTVLLELCQRCDDASLASLSAGPLAPWLTATPEDAAPEALLLALRLWPRLPPAVAAACPLLPAGFKAQQLPASLFTDPTTATGSKAAAAAAAAFFSRQHLSTLLPVLRATTQAHPRLHSVWPTLLALLIPGFSADKEQRGAGGGRESRPAGAPLDAFWSVVVEGDLVQSSHERKYLAFTLFLLLLPHLGPEHIPLVFTPGFLRCLATNLKKNDSHLHAGAKKCMERIAAHCERATPEVRIAVGLALQRHGGGGLEKYAKAAQKGGSSAAAAAAADRGAAGPGADDSSQQADQLQAYVQQLQDAFLKAGQAAAEAASGEAANGGATAGAAQQLQWATEQLCGVLKQAAAPAEAKHSVLQFLAVHALFSVDTTAAKKSKDPGVKAAARSVDIPLPQRQLCAARLISLADSLDKQQQQHAPTGRKQQGQQGSGQRQERATQQAQQQQQQQQQQQEYIAGVAAYVGRLRGSGAVELATAAEGEAAAVEAAEAAAASLEGALLRLQARLAAGDDTAREQQRLRALAHLLRLLLLHSLADPAAADASLAADLATVYSVAIEGEAVPQQAQRAAGGGGEQQGGGSSDEEMAGGEEGDEEAPVAPHWHDTLMDVLLSLLARSAAPLPSAPLRDAVEHVFRAFADDLTATGMQDMLRVLAKPLESGAADEEGDVYASSEEEDGEGSEDEGEGDDDDEEEEEEEQVPSSEQEEDEEGDEGGSGSDEGEEAGAQGGEDGSDSDDEGMSDEAMFRMDAKLASYFATLKEGKGRGAARAARDELINFKMRVAGLLEAFCKRVPGSPLLPAAVAPLLAGLAGASRQGGHQALAERLSGLIANRLCASKAEAAGASLAGNVLEAPLRRTLYLASRSTDKRLAGAAGASYVFLQRAAAASPDAACRAKGADSAKAALADFFNKKKSRLQRPLLEGLLRRVPGLLPAALPEALKQAAKGRNEFLRHEAYELLGAALKSNPAAAGEALAASGPSVAAAVQAAAAGQFGKAARQVDALKIACQLVEAAGKASTTGAAGAKAKGGPSWAEARAAVAAAADGAAGNLKLSAALQRLEGLLDKMPAQAGGGTPASGAAPAAATDKAPAGGKPKHKAALTPAGKPEGGKQQSAGTPAAKPAGGRAEGSKPAAKTPAGKPAAKAEGGRTPGSGDKRGGSKQAGPRGSGKKQKV